MLRQSRAWIYTGLVILVAIAIALLFRCRVPSPAEDARPRVDVADPTRRGSGFVEAGTAAPLPGWFIRRAGAATVIAGTVFRDGKPAPDAAVTLQSSLSLAGAAPERSQRSDAHGRFSFGVVPPARYTVIASAPDRIAASVEVDLGRPTAVPPPSQLELHLGRCEATIMGVVRDASGGVVQGASIGTNHVGYFPVRTTHTDDQGQYRMCVTRGIHAISVAAAGYGAVERVMPVLGTRRFDVALSPAGTIEGVVVDASGAAVGQAAVRLQGRPDDVERVSDAIAVTDAQGHFHLEVFPGPAELFAITEHGVSQRAAVELKPGEIVRDLVLRVPPQARIRGHVRMSGAPAPGIELSFSSSNGHGDTVSEADGSFAVATGPIGAVRIYSPSHRVVTGADLTVPAGGVDGVVVEVAPLASIIGRAETSGSPAVAARIRLSRPGEGWTAVADLRGAFRIPDLMAGNYELEASDDGGRAVAPSMRVAVADGEVKDVGTIQLMATGRIAGRVVDELGAPVAEATVVAEPGGPEAGLAGTDETGAFVVEGLAPVMQRLRVDLRRAALEIVGGRTRLDLAAAPEVDDVTLRVRVHRVQITGRVVDAAGEPMPDVSVFVRGEGDARSWSFVAASAVTAGDGRFRVDNLSGGRYTVRAARRGGGDVVLGGVEAPRDGLEIVLAAQGAIEGRLEQFSGPVDVVVTSAADHRSRRARVDGDQFVLRDLAAGDYLIVAHGGNATATASVRVAPPGTARPVLRAEAARRVTGVVRDLAAKTPVLGMVCAAAPVASAGAKLWYATGPTAADGRFEIEVGADEVAIVCDGDPSVVEAARATSGKLVELWTVRRASHGVAAIGAVFHEDPLVPRIDAVAEHSVAWRMGLRAGDVLVRMADQALDGVGTEAVIELWLQRFAGAELGVRRGDKIVMLRPQG